MLSFLKAVYGFGVSPVRASRCWESTLYFNPLQKVQHRVFICVAICLPSPFSESSTFVIFQPHSFAKSPFQIKPLHTHTLQIRKIQLNLSPASSLPKIYLWQAGARRRAQMQYDKSLPIKFGKISTALRGNYFQELFMAAFKSMCVTQAQHSYNQLILKA